MNNQRSFVWIGFVLAAVILGAGYFFRSGAKPEVLGTGGVTPPVQSEFETSTQSAIDPTKVELIRPDTPLEGPFAAKVTLMEFLDYECPACAAYHPIMQAIREEFKGKIKYAVRQFPLTESHRFAKGASIAAVCAQKQGKFFEYSDVLFANRQYLRRADLERYAEEMGMDAAAFKACLDDKTVADLVVRDRQEGEALGVLGTPTLFINGKRLDDLPGLDDLRRRLNQGLGR